MVLTVTVGVVGAGPTGALVSCFLARKGYNVNVYDMRVDPRIQKCPPGKSINLTLSERGRLALRVLGIEDNIVKNHSIKMNARLVHHINGSKRVFPYGQSDQYLYSINRQILNELLLSECEKYENIHVKFNHKLIDADLNSGAMSFMLRDDETNIIHDRVDYIIGCDGAFSKVKRIMSKFVRFDCSQQYLDHGYIELLIPPKSNGDQALEDGFVHSWPRGTFMLMAFPNLDNSFNVILFMSLTAFESIRSDEEVIQFFEHYFPDAIDLIGKKELIKTFFTTKPSPLISTKCKPYNYCDKALLMGDSAHAMSPFLAQGMNCGFEDCLILDQLLDKHNSLSKVFPLFSDSRIDDCHTIVDLSMDNYIEIRDSINSLGFMIRKYFDLTLNHLFPNHWIPVYSMVAFHTIPYHKCRKYKEWQESMIYSIKTLILLTLMLGLVYSCWEYLT